METYCFRKVESPVFRGYEFSTFLVQKSHLETLLKCKFFKKIF